jgi:hypothetical protein
MACAPAEFESDDMLKEPPAGEAERELVEACEVERELVELCGVARALVEVCVACWGEGEEAEGAVGVMVRVGEPVGGKMGKEEERGDVAVGVVEA